MLAGEFDRFDVFSGPITDNQGNTVLAEGESLEQVDLDGFAQFGAPCNTCMYWWNENVTAELPELES
jgi:basic membrane protein A